MAVLCRWILVLTTLLAAGPRLWAASPEETRAFSAATNIFRLGFHDKAEAAFAGFVQTYTNSTHLAEVILYQAQARIQRTNYAGAIELLSAHLGAAGTNADQYVFWLGEAQFRKGDYPAARDAFAKLVKEFPASSRRLEAGIGEATARMKLGDWAGVVAVLQQADGVFQSAVRSNITNELVSCGHLLLTEAKLAQKDYPAAEAALKPLAGLQLSPARAWQRQYLLCRILLAQGQTEAALLNTTNLVALATNAAQSALVAESAALQAGLLEQAGRSGEALAVYHKNLAEQAPAEYQRQALWKIMSLSLAQNRIAEAAQVLQQFLARDPQAPSADMALLTLGEIRLRQYVTGQDTKVIPAAVTNAPAATNALDLALGSLQELVRRFPKSPVLGKAHLDMGWCFWLTNNLPASQTNFQAAVEGLPFSADQAIACFKLADTQLRLKDFAGAISNYTSVITRFREFPEVETNLFEPALYQIVQAGVAAGNLAAATNALAQLLARYPTGYNTQGALLLAGLEVSRQGNPTGARQMFLDFVQAAPNDPMRPAVELAIARTYEQQDQWTDAFQRYNLWLTNFPASDSRPQAEFYRAQAAYQASDLTNALAGFTNFVGRFPTNALTPLAQMWVGNYYFQRGVFVEAEKSYRWLSQTNWPVSDLTYQAQMMAGRAAFARQDWDKARGYFTDLYNNTNCAEDLRIQALLACGSCYMSQDSTNRASDFQQAIEIFKRICDRYPTNPLAALAWGERANALMQWAKSSEQYDDVTNAFHQVIVSTNANVAARSQAKIGLAIALEKKAEQSAGINRTDLLNQALANCLDVFVGGNLHDGEEAALFWRKEAGLYAGRLAEKLQQWDQAKNVYIQLKDLVPALSPRLDNNIRRCEERRSGASS